MIRFAEEMLVACAALDRAETLSALITEDGEVIRTKTGLKSHPSIRDEIQLWAFVVRTLHRLGLDVEPLRSGPGKPPSTYGGGRPLKGGVLRWGSQRGNQFVVRCSRICQMRRSIRRDATASLHVQVRQGGLRKYVPSRRLSS